ncbi:MAG: tetratricopeptide repeat protein [Treponema sp.]|nr:tetratricopeptide repeat protein [Treponema sp.]
MKQYELKNESLAKKKSHLLRNILLGFAGTVILGIIIFFSVFFIIRFSNSRISTKTLQKYWNSKDDNRYLLIIKDGKEILDSDPFNNTALIYYGYASFYTAVSQTDSALMQSYLEECINSLRQALYSAKEKTKPQIFYMLGKAYFYKNRISGNYYADLTVEYLNKALAFGYAADDIYEYLGMSYAALDMPTESIAAFSQSLLTRESDNLLVSIAEQYMKTGQYNSSKQYLFRVIKSCENEALREKSHIILGNIYLEEQNFTDAEKEFAEVLQINENSTDAHYGIGVIYEKQGNLAKARSEWRATLKLQANHSGALKKLSENKK